MKSNDAIKQMVKLELQVLVSVVAGDRTAAANLIRNSLFLYDDERDEFDQTQKSLSLAAQTFPNRPPSPLAQLLSKLPPNTLGALVRRSADRTYTLIDTIGTP